MGAVLNISVDQGSTFTTEITLMQSDGVTPIDLTGFTLRSEIRKTYQSTTVTASFLLTVLDVVGGKIRLELLDTTTEAIKKGRYVYDVELISPHLTSEVSSITITEGGSGYIATPTVVFDNSATTGTGATGTAIVDNGVVSSVTMTNRGSGYDIMPVVSFTGGGGTGAKAVANRGGNVERVLQGRVTVDPESTR